MRRGSFNIPKDVEIQILLRLPITSLMRFKCVCKSWNSLLKSQYFIQNHYNKISAIENIDCIVIRDPRGFSPSEKNDPGKKVIASLLSGNKMEVFSDIDLPNYEGEKVRSIIGSVNGIICLQYETDVLALFNPATKEFKGISKPLPLDHGKCAPNIAFDFDLKSNDYKVVRVVDCDYDFETENYLYAVQIHTLRNDSWRELPDVKLPGCLQYPSPINVQREGVYHFITYTRDRILLVTSFDMHLETFRNFKIPEIEDPFDNKMISPAVLNGCIALIIYNIGCIDTRINIWEMKEYGNEESWVKKHTIASIPAEPISIWNSNKLLLQNKVGDDFWNSSGELISYDLHTEEVKEHRVHGLCYSMWCFPYMPTMISFKAKNCIEEFYH